MAQENCSYSRRCSSFSAVVAGTVFVFRFGTGVASEVEARFQGCSQRTRAARWLYYPPAAGVGSHCALAGSVLPMSKRCCQIEFNLSRFLFFLFCTKKTRVDWVPSIQKAEQRWWRTRCAWLALSITLPGQPRELNAFTEPCEHASVKAWQGKRSGP